MSMYGMQAQWAEIEAAVRDMDRAEVMRRFGTPVRQRHYNGIDWLRFDFGETKCSRLNIELDGRRVRRCWCDIVLPDPHDTLVFTTPGIEGPVLAWKKLGLQAVAHCGDARVLHPLRLPERGIWIMRAADRLDAPRWYLDVGDRKQIAQRLYHGQFIQIVDGPFRDGREALRHWPQPPRQPQTDPNPLPSSPGDP